MKENGKKSSLHSKEGFSMSRLTDKELIELMREENKQDKTKADEVSAEIDREIW